MADSRPPVLDRAFLNAIQNVLERFHVPEFMRNVVTVQSQYDFRNRMAVIETYIPHLNFAWTATVPQDVVEDNPNPEAIRSYLNDSINSHFVPLIVKWRNRPYDFFAEINKIDSPEKVRENLKRELDKQINERRKKLFSVVSGDRVLKIDGKE